MQRDIRAGDANKADSAGTSDHELGYYRCVWGITSTGCTAFHGRQLIVVTNGDHMVNAAPALEFASLARADVFVLKGECGHMSPHLCERERLEKEVESFLAAAPQER